MTRPHRIPAFAAALLARRRAGFAPRKDLLIATAWDLGKAWAPWRIVVGANHDPANLDFSVCAGLSCLLLANDQRRMDEVARAITQSGPLRLIGVALDADVCMPYVPARELKTE